MWRFRMLGLLPMIMIVSCTQPMRTSPFVATPSALAATRSGSLQVELPDAEFDYSVDTLLRDSVVTWLRQERSAVEASALDCLTEAVYYEARSEPMAGQRAVAQVVLNRVGKRGFSRSVCGVVRQRNASGDRCQFNFNCDGSRTGRREPHAWSVARSVARQSLSGDAFALIGSATFYHSTAAKPDWASRFKRITQIGSQIFYRS